MNVSGLNMILGAQHFLKNIIELLIDGIKISTIIMQPQFNVKENFVIRRPNNLKGVDAL